VLPKAESGGGGEGVGGGALGEADLGLEAGGAADGGRPAKACISVSSEPHLAESKVQQYARGVRRRRAVGREAWGRSGRLRMLAMPRMNEGRRVAVAS